MKRCSQAHKLLVWTTDTEYGVPYRGHLTLYHTPRNCRPDPPNALYQHMEYNPTADQIPCPGINRLTIVSNITSRQQATPQHRHTRMHGNSLHPVQLHTNKTRNEQLRHAASPDKSYPIHSIAEVFLLHSACFFRESRARCWRLDHFSWAFVCMA